jgi:hypothetical protein
MSATALQLNWISVQHASTAITRVTSVTFSQGGELIEFSGDNARFPQVITNNVSRPRCSVTSGDVATLMGIAVGTSGTFTAEQLDALAQIGGAINWTMSNAVHESSDDSGNWGNFASATANFRAYASDGATNPLSFTRS